MDQYKTDPAQRPQTLIEAAKALFGGPIVTGDLWNNLRAAIAREEAKPSDFWQSCLDRAQQAESTAAWHKAESARLSAELAKERERADGMERAGQEQSRRADTNQADMIEWRERAEKAEADAGTLRNQLTLAVERSERLSEQIKGSEYRNQNLLRAVDEQRDQFADAAGLGRKFSTERDLMKRVDELSEQLKSAQKQCGVERTEVERLRAALGGPQVGIVRDPVTGWTFATYRRVVEALGGKS